MRHSLFWRLSRIVLLMIIFIFPFTPASTLAITRPDQSLTSSEFSGLWIAYGYSCNDTTVPEQINVQATNTTITATKITGDACIGAGQVTWTAQITNGEIPAQFNIQLHTTSSPVSVSARLETTEIMVINAGSGIYYYRIGIAPPASFPINIDGFWLGTGYICTNFLPTELVLVQTDGNNVTATKQTGDECINPGEVTWKTTLTALTGPTTLPTQLQIGDSTGFRQFLDGKIQFVSPDLIIIYDVAGIPPIEFRRFIPTNHAYLPKLWR